MCVRWLTEGVDGGLGSRAGLEGASVLGFAVDNSVAPILWVSSLNEKETVTQYYVVLVACRTVFSLSLRSFTPHLR